MVAALCLPLLGCAALKPSGGSGGSAEHALSPPEVPARNVVRVERPPDRSEPLLQRTAASLARLPENFAKALEPSNHRDWRADMAVLPYADFDGDRVTVHNIRNADYRTPDDYTLDYYDKTYELDKLKSVDFIMVPFLGSPDLAHMMISFGFEGEEYLCVSVEIRPEEGEKYVPLYGVLRQFELMYVIADERDLVKQCTDVFMRGVYVYPARLSREEGRGLFVDMMRRANQLATRPEFYNTFTNNCTTNLVRHLNSLGTRKVPYTYHVFFPGHFDRLLYDLGLIDNERSFAQTRLRARVNRLAYLYADSPDYSAKIRQ